jgi:hypothetical protein
MVVRINNLKHYIYLLESVINMIIKFSQGIGKTTLVAKNVSLISTAITTNITTTTTTMTTTPPPPPPPPSPP